MTREEEYELVLRVRDGDSDSFEALVLDNQTKVYNLALRMVGNEDDAFDMSQEAFLKAYNSLEGFRGDSRFSVWLYRLTTNVCLDFLRSKARRKYESLTLICDEDDGREVEIPDERFSPESQAERKELRQALYRGLKALPPDYRAILLLREIDGLSYEEIGAVLSLEPGTVKSRIFRARKRLCEILAEDRNFSYAPTSKERKEV